MNKNLFYVPLITTSLLMGGCATITSGTSQSVAVITEKGVEGAKCELTDKKGRVYYLPSTPGNTSVHKGDGPMTVICKKEGYKTATVQIDESLAGATFGNILIGGVIGAGVDAMSGAAQKYPDQIVVWMEPEEWASDEAKTAWLEAKAAYDSSLSSKKKSKDSQEKEDSNL